MERNPRDALGRPQGESWWGGSWVRDDLPGEPRGFRYGDLIEGIGAVTALIVMLAIGLNPWLAVPLSIVTYLAVFLLRPTGERQDEPAGEPVGEAPGIAATVEGQDPEDLPDGTLAGVEAVAACFRLTPREQEILPLLAQRLTDREIAERLSISHRTAMNHTANILGKLGLTSRRDVTAFVARHGLLPSSTSPPRP